MRLRAGSARLFVLILCTLCSSSLCNFALRAQDDAGAVERLLDAGWRAGAKPNSQVDQLYRNLTPSSHLDFAYALAKIRQGRYEDAIAITEPLLDDPIHGLNARRMRVWLLTIRRRYSDALVEMQRLAEKLPAGEAEAIKERRRETVVLLGAMAGFFRGPAHESITDFEVESRVRRIIAPLTEEEKKLFDVESDRVLDEYAGRVGEREKMVTDATREAEEEKARKKKELEELRKAADEELAKLNDSQRRMDEDTKSELDRIAASDQPLRSQLASLETDAAIVRNNLTSVWFDIALVQDQLAVEEDPVVRGYLFRELTRLTLYADQLGSELAALDVTAGGVQSERSSLAAQHQSVQSQYAQRRNQLEKNRDAIEGQLRRADREEKKLSGADMNIRRAARSRDAKTKALQTYVPFPAEAERDRLLALAGD